MDLKPVILAPVASLETERSEGNVDDLVACGLDGIGAAEIVGVESVVPKGKINLARLAIIRASAY